VSIPNYELTLLFHTTPILSLPTGLGSQHKAWSRLKIAAGNCCNAGHINYTTGYQTVVH